jgi:hypothetical protein
MSGCASQLSRTQDSPWFIDTKKIAILPARLLALIFSKVRPFSVTGPDSRSLESFHLVGKPANRGCGYP